MYSEVGYGPATIAMPGRQWNVTVPDLLPGFVKVDRGGVVRIAELQAQGYAYLRRECDLTAERPSAAVLPRAGTAPSGQEGMGHFVGLVRHIRLHRTTAGITSVAMIDILGHLCDK
jgi:hypothetical protein